MTKNTKNSGNGKTSSLTETALPHAGNEMGIKQIEPSATELAIIAATLKRSNNSADCSELASDALHLWESCSQEIQKRKDRLECHSNNLYLKISKPEKE